MIITKLVLGLVLAATGFLLLFIFLIMTIIKSSQDKPISFKALGIQAGIVLACMVIGGFMFVQSIFQGAKKSVKTAREYAVTAEVESRDAASEGVALGATALGEGIGKTADYFENKWKEQNLKEIKNVSFNVVTWELKNGFARLNVAVQNSNDDSINLNDYISKQMLLVEDEQGYCFPFKPIHDGNLNFIPAGIKSTRWLESAVKLDNGLSKLVWAAGEHQFRD